MEARCEAFSGKIYFKGLKLFKKAKQHLANAVRLELTLRPRSCANEAWFQRCQKNFGEVTEILQKAEQEAIDAERQQ